MPPTGLAGSTACSPIGCVSALLVCVVVGIVLWPREAQSRDHVLHFQPAYTPLPRLQSSPIPAQIDSKPWTPPPPKLITRADLQGIDWFQFEKVIAALYESRGNRVEQRGGQNADGGIDLVLHHGGRRAAVQCKHWKAWKAGVRQMREFFGAMKAEGFEHGVFVILQECTKEAQDFAQQHGIKIVDGMDVENMLQKADPLAVAKIRAIIDDPVKHCPKCSAPMVMRTSKRGLSQRSQFWGCSTYPRCRGKMKVIGA